MSATANLKSWFPWVRGLEKKSALQLAAFVFFATNLAFEFPEAADFDSRLNLVCRLAFHWSGFWLIADGLLFLGRRTTARAFLLAGAFPFFIQPAGVIFQNDSMASVFLAACGMVFWHRIRQQPLPASAMLAVVSLLAYGTLLRVHAVFAMGPLLIYSFASEIRVSRAREWLTASVATAVLALPVGAWVHGYLHGHLTTGEDSWNIQSLLRNGMGGTIALAADYPAAITLAAALFFLAGGAVILWLTRGEHQNPSLQAARCLALSGTLYLASLAGSGLATDIRYACWGQMAVLLATILGADAWARKRWHDRP